MFRQECSSNNKVTFHYLFIFLFPWVGRKWTKDERSGQWPPAVACGEDNQHNKNRMAEGCGQEGWGRKLTEGPVHSESFRKPLPTSYEGGVGTRDGRGVGGEGECE